MSNRWDVDLYVGNGSANPSTDFNFGIPTSPPRWIQSLGLVVAEGANLVQKLEPQLASAHGQQAENRTLTAECEARIKWCEQEATKFAWR
jgi:hypothetical protein